MSTMAALQLSRQLTLRTMRSPQPSLLTRSLLLSRPASSSSKPAPKGRLLEKPTRFNPPSHPARLPRRSRQPAFQVPLSAKERDQQKKKQYPHMMPPEGTFFHWFLTNRNIHVWITMVSPTSSHTASLNRNSPSCPVHPHIPGLFHLAEQFPRQYTIPRPTARKQHVLLPPDRFPLPLRRCL